MARSIVEPSGTAPSAAAAFRADHHKPQPVSSGDGPIATTPPLLRVTAYWGVAAGGVQLPSFFPGPSGVTHNSNRGGDSTVSPAIQLSRYTSLNATEMGGSP